LQEIHSMEQPMMRLSRAGRVRPQLKDGFELRLPSQLGYEKVAMDTVATAASRMNFAAERISSLRSAIAEAVTNAIEHGNYGIKNALVCVQIVPSSDRLTVVIRDQGGRRLPLERTHAVPSLTRAMSGSDEGWGMWLIRQLVDEAEWRVSPSGGNEVRLVLYTRPASDGPGGGGHGVSG
jgi:serine/threonine-protein kinase RsbW